MRTRRKYVEGFRVNEQVLVTKLRVFTCTNHDGFHGASSHRASVVVARDEMHARELLDKALVANGLKPFNRVRYTLHETSTDRYSADILADGSM